MATTISAAPTSTVQIKDSGVGAWQFRVDAGSQSNITGPCTVTNTAPGSGTLKVQFEGNLTINNTNLYFICGSANIQFGNTSRNSDGTRPTFTVDVASYAGLFQNGTVVSATGKNNISIQNLVVNLGTGSLATGAGQIGQGGYSRGGANCTIINCSTTGSIPASGGGITGQNTCIDNGSLTIERCNNTGTCVGPQSGGIVGANTCAQSGTTNTLIIRNCSHVGTLGNSCGGIVGGGSAVNAGNTIQVINCQSSGDIIGTVNAGGIFGSSAGASLGTAFASNCYFTGNLNGATTGGIFGGSAGIATACNCQTTGSIVNGGGIFGSNMASTANAFNCQTTGAKSGFGGGIFQNSALDSKSGSANLYSEANNGSSGWKTSNASNVLLGVPNPPTTQVGSNWAALTVNSAQVLSSSGQTPYSIELVNTQSNSVDQGGTTAGPIVPGYTTFSVLDYVDVSGAEITIDGQGQITVASSTTPGTQTLSVQSSTNPQSITTYTLTVNAVIINTETGAEVSCCEVPIDLPTWDYTTRYAIISGNQDIGGPQRRQPQQSYTEYQNMRMAYAAKRT